MFLWAGCPLAFGAVDFDGVDDYVSLPANMNIFQNVRYMSISIWVNLSSIASESVIIGIGNNSGGSASRFSISHLANAGFRVGVRAGDAESIQNVVATSNAITGTWYHIVGVVDVQTDSILLYINGVEEATTGNPNFTATVTSNTASAVSALGAEEDASTRFFDGLIDDVRVYNRALSASEIEVIAKGRLKYDSLTTPGNGLVGYWPLDDSPDGTSGDGDTFVDRSGTGNNGTGVDGANSTGLTVKASGFLMYPARVQ